MLGEWRLSSPRYRPAQQTGGLLGGDAEVDLALSEFVYELGDRLKQLPAMVAGEERDLLRAARIAPTTFRANTQSGSVRSRSQGSMFSIEQGQTWIGTYHPTDRRLKLMILKRVDRRFHGKIMYTGDGSTTEVDGDLCDFDEKAMPAALQGLEDGVREIAGMVRFREIRIVKKGYRAPQLGGEYLALLGNAVMVGVWQLDGSVRGNFELKLDT